MIKMNFIRLLWFTVLIFNLAYSQTGGVIFEIFETKNCKLNDMQKTNDFSYIIQNKKGDTILANKYTPEEEVFLKTGNYIFSIYLNNYSRIKVISIEVSADRLSLVKILFDEKCQFNRREKRFLRKQNFQNY